MGILDDTFRISNYVDHKNDIFVDQDSNNVDKAIAWSEDNNSIIIINTSDIDDLEIQWIEFNSMTHDQRRISDWKSIELFNRTNRQSYELYRSELLKNDIDNEIDSDFDSLVYDSSIPIKESADEDDELNYTSEDVENAIKWSEENDKTIIIPTRTLSELESLWDDFGSMHHKHCRESDWKSIELFGVTNLKHYEYLKNQFLRSEANRSDLYKYASVTQFLESVNTKNYYRRIISEMTYNHYLKNIIDRLIPMRTVYEDALISNALSGINDDIGSMSELITDPSITSGDLPYINPDDMITSGVFSDVPADNYYGELADNTMLNSEVSVREWFNMYKALYDGFYTEFYSLNTDWINTVRNLTNGLNKMIESGYSKSKINSRKQSILELGWNPDIEFTYKNRIIAREFTSKSMSNNINVSKVIDLSGFRNTHSTNTAINEQSTTSRLNPLYITLIEGKSVAATLIKKFTNSDYTHATISLDPTLKRMYSFGMIDNDGKISGSGGFRIEDVNDTKDERKMSVYCVFLHNKEYDKVLNFINYFRDNINSTKYNYKNLVRYMFNIPSKSGMNMICSQFVDRCFKIAGIDITHKDSSLVSPEDLHKASNNNKNIYKLYSGSIEKYNSNNILNNVKALLGKVNAIKEEYTDERRYLLDISNNIFDLRALRELHSGISVVKNDDIRNFLEHSIFDNISAIAYDPGVPARSNSVDLDFINSEISKHFNMK